MIGYVGRDDTIYQNTRRFILSQDNPYYMFGPVINGYFKTPAFSASQTHSPADFVPFPSS